MEIIGIGGIALACVVIWIIFHAIDGTL